MHTAEINAELLQALEGLLNNERPADVGTPTAPWLAQYKAHMAAQDQARAVVAKARGEG